ncbi:MarR family winged helix-turn-helix transcriptional regulator [Lysobacter sp. TAF61]|uniref:MarR family winged helix-turn-helix transcriptional regulator n=1 Tax=Lysobacter sp. TAF61 TaxID=3233072 RepID=UPI003F9D1759
MSIKSSTLGTLLRNLIEHLDGAVEEAYSKVGLDYRPRYTPVMRALLELGPSSIRSISEHAGMTHSATSQTVSQMAKQGLLRLRSGDDGRERIVEFTAAAKRMIPQLEQHWSATEKAARSLEKDMSMPLSAVLRDAIATLDKKSFASRIEEAHRSLAKARKNS